MRILYVIVLGAVLASLSCQNTTKPKSSGINTTEQQAVLDSLGKNMEASISDLTEAKRIPTNEFVIKSYYPLSAQEPQALNIAEEKKGSFASDVADQIHCLLVGAELRNENGEAVKLADVDQNPLYLQRFGLWEYHQQLSQNVGIGITTASTFSKLNGYIKLELRWGEHAKKQIEVPIAISIQDILKD